MQGARSVRSSFLYSNKIKVKKLDQKQANKLEFGTFLGTQNSKTVFGCTFFLKRCIELAQALSHSVSSDHAYFTSGPFSRVFAMSLY